MAVVQIPMGGGMIGIDVPDFAMEATQQDLLSYTQQQVNILSAIASNSGLTVQTIKNTSQQTIANANKNSQQQAATLLGGVRNLVGASAKVAAAAFNNIQTDTTASQFTEKMFAGMGLADVGAGVGSIIGIAEEFASQMSALGRIGASLGQNFIQLRNDAANIGLGLDQFGKIVTDAGPMVGSLADNATDGSNRFIKFTAALRSATESAGYFGMSSAEMAQFTADELELRRQMYDTEYNRNLNEKDLAVQLKENLTLQSAMARITGQDVRDRIKAQQDFKRDAIGASVMANLTKEQQVSMGAAISGFSQFGPMTEVVTNAFRNMVAGMPASDEFYALTSVLSGQGVDLLGSMQDQVAMVKEAAPGEQITAAVDAMAGEFKNVDTSVIQTLAMSGVDSAVTILQGKLGTVASGADTMVESTAKINTAMDAFATAVANGSLKIQGTSANIEEFLAESKALVTDSILKSVGIDVTNIEAFQTGFAGLSESLTNLPDNEKFRELVSTAIGAAFKLSGATSVASAMGIGGEKSPTEVLAENAMIGALLAQVSGMPEEVVKALKIPMKAVVVTDVAKSVAKLSGQELLIDTVALMDTALNGLTGAINNAATKITESVTGMPTAGSTTNSSSN